MKARFSRDKHQEREWQEEKGHSSTSREGTTNGRGEINEQAGRKDKGEKYIHSQEEQLTVKYNTIN